MCPRWDSNPHSEEPDLSQARLPIPPLGLALKGTHKILPYRLAENRITKEQEISTVFFESSTIVLHLDEKHTNFQPYTVDEVLLTTVE